MPRGFLAVCGQETHGKSVAGGGVRVCFACGRPGSRDGSSSKWKHVGTGPYWADFGEWTFTLGEAWTHARDLAEAPFVVGECLCVRADCAAGMYHTYKTRCEKEEKGSMAIMAIDQSSPMGRYPSTGGQVRALVAHVDLTGEVLDCCGSSGDAVCVILRARAMHVTTNDFDPSLIADSHMDASTNAFREAFMEDGRRPDWVVTSPPYGNALGILKQALRVSRVGVAFKPRLTFLEPTLSRGPWFTENPPDKVVVLPRATYRGRKCSSVEAWFVWEKMQSPNRRVGPAFCFALH